ncbi:MAG: phosphotransferase [Candidatus Latescibacteria bacterium]|nr:phosphotransferase [Candidatus Latescibacterota bacterium]
MLEDGDSDQGTVNSVERIGNTVRRPIHRWSSVVHSLLRYLEAADFSGVPQFLGTDESGREILSFIPGEVALRPWPEVMLEETGLIQVTQFLVHYHSAVRDFQPDEDAKWHVPHLAWRPGMIIRHGDLGPWNTIWAGRSLSGVIDWDFAEPGDPLHDVAQFAWYSVPLRGDRHWKKVGFLQEPDIASRLAAISETYGTDPATLLSALLDLQKEECRRIEILGKQGVAPWNIFHQRGHLAEISAENTWLSEKYDSLVL